MIASRPRDTTEFKAMSHLSWNQMDPFGNSMPLGLKFN